MPDPGDRPNFVSKGELLAEIERLKAIIVSDTHVLLTRRPVAFRYKNAADEWVLTASETAADDALMAGHDTQGLYARVGA